MEVYIGEHPGIPEDAIISVRFGSVRRQASLQTAIANPFKFPTPLEACCEPLKIDVLQQLSSTRLVLQSNQLKYDIGLNEQGSMRVGFDIRHVQGEEVKQDGSKEQGLLKFQDTATDARKYLESHGLLRYVQALLHAVIQVKPVDPYNFMLDQLLAAQKTDCTASAPGAAPAEPVAPAPAEAPAEAPSEPVDEAPAARAPAAPPTLVVEPPAEEAAPPPPPLSPSPPPPSPKAIQPPAAPPPVLQVEAELEPAQDANLQGQHDPPATPALPVEDLKFKALSIMEAAANTGKLESALLDIFSKEAPPQQTPKPAEEEAASSADSAQPATAAAEVTAPQPPAAPAEASASSPPPAAPPAAPSQEVAAPKATESAAPPPAAVPTAPVAEAAAPQAAEDAALPQAAAPAEAPPPATASAAPAPAEPPAPPAEKKRLFDVVDEHVKEAAEAENLGKRVLIVTTSAAALGDHATGLWSEECCGPYYYFKDRGCFVKVVSTAGGDVPIDKGSLSDTFKTDSDRKMEAEEWAALKGTGSFADEDLLNFDILFFAGGHGTCVDFPTGEVGKIVGDAVEAGKVVAAVCHGSTALVHATVPDSESGEQRVPVVKGKKVACFSNKEEDMVELSDKVPFLLETKLAELGAIVEVADPWKEQAVRDGTLITGQNPQSSVKCAELALEAALEEAGLVKARLKMRAVLETATIDGSLWVTLDALRRGDLGREASASAAAADAATGVAAAKGTAAPAMEADVDVEAARAHMRDLLSSSVDTGKLACALETVFGSDGEAQPPASTTDAEEPSTNASQVDSTRAEMRKLFEESANSGQLNKVLEAVLVSPANGENTGEGADAPTEERELEDVKEKGRAALAAALEEEEEEPQEAVAQQRSHEPHAQEPEDPEDAQSEEDAAALEEAREKGRVALAAALDDDEPQAAVVDAGAGAAAPTASPEEPAPPAEALPAGAEAEAPAVVKEMAALKDDVNNMKSSNEELQNKVVELTHKIDELKSIYSDSARSR